MATERPKPPAAEPAANATPTGPKIRWDDSHMQTAYANVCNVASTREEVVLLFGINQAWQAGQAEIPIQLSSRISIQPLQKAHHHMDCIFIIDSIAGEKLPSQN